MWLQKARHHTSLKFLKHQWFASNFDWTKGVLMCGSFLEIRLGRIWESLGKSNLHKSGCQLFRIFSYEIYHTSLTSTKIYIYTTWESVIFLSSTVQIAPIGRLLARLGRYGTLRTQDQDNDPKTTPTTHKFRWYSTQFRPRIAENQPRIAGQIINLSLLRDFPIQKLEIDKQTEVR